MLEQKFTKQDIEKAWCSATELWEKHGDKIVDWDKQVALILFDILLRTFFTEQKISFLNLPQAENAFNLLSPEIELGESSVLVFKAFVKHVNFVRQCVGEKSKPNS